MSKLARVAYRSFKNSTVVHVQEVNGTATRFSGNDSKHGKLQTLVSGNEYFEPYDWNFVPSNVKIGLHDAERFECQLFRNLYMVECEDGEGEVQSIDTDQFTAVVEPLGEPMSLLDLQKLLSVVECLIDTAQNTTDLESVYDDSKEQSFTWEDVFKSYSLLKKLACVE